MPSTVSTVVVGLCLLIVLPSISHVTQKSQQGTTRAPSSGNAGQQNIQANGGSSGGTSQTGGSSGGTSQTGGSLGMGPMAMLNFGNNGNNFDPSHSGPSPNQGSGGPANPNNANPFDPSRMGPPPNQGGGGPANPNNVDPSNPLHHLTASTKRPTPAPTITTTTTTITTTVSSTPPFPFTFPPILPFSSSFPPIAPSLRPSAGASSTRAPVTSHPPTMATSGPTSYPLPPAAASTLKVTSAPGSFASLPNSGLTAQTPPFGFASSSTNSPSSRQTAPVTTVTPITTTTITTSTSSVPSTTSVKVSTAKIANSVASLASTTLGALLISSTSSTTGGVPFLCPGLFNCALTCTAGYINDNQGCPLCLCAQVPTNIP
ncbi:mucin-5AC-like [Aplysia californica]|uniref:Mucin-5AC-like n=1 Tax=Aplysia californica TaxID=6500 RepID=A0ABM1W0T5_APLCA|nr:mucin-5AC-like [Aplysia californica]